MTFVSNLYDESTAVFQERVRKIDAGEPPFVDNRSAEDEDVTEPLFDEQYHQAGEFIEVIGHWCLCMVYGSCKAYLEEYIREMERDYRGLGDLRQKLAVKKAKNWFERYRLLFLEELGIDWRKGPVELAELEHLNLARDDVTQNP